MDDAKGYAFPTPRSRSSRRGANPARSHPVGSSNHSHRPISEADHGGVRSAGFRVAQEQRERPEQLRGGPMGRRRAGQGLEGTTGATPGLRFAFVGSLPETDRPRGALKFEAVTGGSPCGHAKRPAGRQAAGDMNSTVVWYPLPDEGEQSGGSERVVKRSSGYRG